MTRRKNARRAPVDGAPVVASVPASADTPETDAPDVPKITDRPHLEAVIAETERELSALDGRKAALVAKRGPHAMLTKLGSAEASAKLKSVRAELREIEDERETLTEALTALKERLIFVARLEEAANIERRKGEMKQLAMRMTEVSDQADSLIRQLGEVGRIWVDLAIAAGAYNDLHKRSHAVVVHGWAWKNSFAIHPALRFLLDLRAVRPSEKVALGLVTRRLFDGLGAELPELPAESAPRFIPRLVAAAAKPAVAAAMAAPMAQGEPAESIESLIGTPGLSPEFELACGEGRVIADASGARTYASREEAQEVLAKAQADNPAELGGVVARTIKTTIAGKLTSLAPGAILMPSLVAAWPFANRMALAESGRIQLYVKPAGESAVA